MLGRGRSSVSPHVFHKAKLDDEQGLLCSSSRAFPVLRRVRWREATLGGRLRCCGSDESLYGGPMENVRFHLDNPTTPDYSEGSQSGPIVTNSCESVASPSNRLGEEVKRQMTITINHEKVKEVTREEVDRAIDVIERHLEKEARTRNLLDEQAIMRPKDLCKQQGLDMVAELRGMM